MGHRAMVAYEQAPDEYELHYSHWGAIDGRLIHKIGPDTPYADGDVDQEVWEGHHQTGLREILDDVMHYATWEAFYIVTDDWDVSMWVPVEYGEAGRGMLVPVRTYRDRETSQERAAQPAAVTARVEAIWATAADLHDDHEEAVEYVESTLREQYHGHQSPGDQPTLSTESPLPAQFRAGTMQMSELAGGGR